MALVLRVEEQLDGETVRSVELRRADGAASIAAPGALGLRLADAKVILTRLQTEVVASQVGQLCRRNAACRWCGTRLRIKDYRPRRLDTLFGRVTLRLPRRGCPSCRTTPAIDAVFASRATPELVLTQAKLAAHLPYRVAGRLLGDLLPLDAGISHTAIRSWAMTVGRRLGRRPTDPPAISDPSPMIVTIDGAFIRAVSAAGVRHTQVLVGSIERPGKRRQVFAAVGAAGISVADAVRARLHELGASTTAHLTVLTDGEEGLHSLAASDHGNPVLPILDGSMQRPGESGDGESGGCAIG